MGQDLFKYLPSEIMLDILSRLPAPTTMKCKCVCKPWLYLLSTPELVKSHLSKSVPCMVVFLKVENSKPYRIIEFEDEHRWNIFFNFDHLPPHERLHSSVNGLVLLYRGLLNSYADLYLCNPITRDYIKIPSPRYRFSKCICWLVTYGFGVSRMSCQYKVVRLFNVTQTFTGPHTPLGSVECQIYTVGTGSWRGIPCDGRLGYEDNIASTFLNGSLHWLAFNGSSIRISCLDLETELFSTFSPPPLDDCKIWRLIVLGDCLSVCCNSCHSSLCEIDIWLMKKYGEEESWTKEFVIPNVDMLVGYAYPIKVFKDGDILLKWFGNRLLYYSSKTKAIEHVDDVFGFDNEIFRITTNFTPSFVSLKTFAMENAISF